MCRLNLLITRVVFLVLLIAIPFQAIASQTKVTPSKQRIVVYVADG